MSAAKKRADPEPEVRAAGGIVRREQRPRGRRRVQLLIVHRPRYDDWSLPKGKQDAHDADDEATALREVAEETGFACTLGSEVGETRYRDSKGRDKLVRYWLMDLPEGTTGDDFEPNGEVDELRWCSPAEADRMLSYEHDRAQLARIGDRRVRSRRP